MKASTTIAASASCMLLAATGLLASAGGSSDPYRVQLNATQAGPGQLELTWAGGRPAYQLQQLRALDEQWTNVGEPTTATSAIVAQDAAMGFFRVIDDYTARYEVTLDATWSEATHPQDWPRPGHWSGLVGAVHNDQVEFYHVGKTASEGIRRMAEQGDQATLLSEVAPAVASGAAQFALRGSGVNPSPGSTRLPFPQPVRRDHSLVTLCSMVAPSPDWFVGVSGLDLIQDGQWRQSVTVDLYPHDAGTDSGVTFRSLDKVTVPRGVITPLQVYPIAVNGSVTPFGTFTFRRLD
ncbi:MAG: spondin domain-containing protein [Verrucomicrobia bacterium]|nr:spondin domain-containing protein [Verrucomicrobiota bacterium]MBI3870184.1 spondin domain-containing protein [Verrucomicrobiota bacterium]